MDSTSTPTSADIGHHRMHAAKRGLAVAISVSIVGIAATVMTHGTVSAATRTHILATAQMATATPSTGLMNGQTVKVHATGFMAGESLVVVECGDKGAATAQGDCDIANAGFVTSSATGTVDATYTAIVGPFAANNITCSAAQACAIQVTQLSTTPTEIAQASISFGAATPVGGTAVPAGAANTCVPAPAPAAVPAPAPAAAPAPKAAAGGSNPLGALAGLLPLVTGLFGGTGGTGGTDILGTLAGLFGSLFG